MRLMFLCKIRAVPFLSFIYYTTYLWVLILPVRDSFGDIRTNSTPGTGSRPADGQRWSNLPAVDSITRVFMHHSFDSHGVFS